MIYFARLHNGLIKIGVTENLVSRIPSLRSKYGGPVQILRTLPGDERTEECFHQLFKEQRVTLTDEVFRPDEMMMRLINEPKAMKILINMDSALVKTLADPVAMTEHVDRVTKFIFEPARRERRRAREKAARETERERLRKDRSSLRSQEDDREDDGKSEDRVLRWLYMMLNYGEQVEFKDGKTICHPPPPPVPSKRIPMKQIQEYFKRKKMFPPDFRL